MINILTNCKSKVKRYEKFAKQNCPNPLLSDKSNESFLWQCTVLLLGNVCENKSWRYKLKFKLLSARIGVKQLQRLLVKQK